MQLTKQQVINHHLPSKTSAGTYAKAFAPSNIALCKYWGKRNVELNLPINSSLSISLANLGTTTSIQPAEYDQVFLNGERQPEQQAFATKVIEFINLFRRDLNQALRIDTHNNIPTAAGLASSASGFAALMLAINDFYQFKLPPTTLSAFARIGSGSAARSIFQGFVEWHQGSAQDGMDSYAEPLNSNWKKLNIALLKISTASKKTNSRQGMQRTVKTATLYQSWQQQATADLATIKSAIKHQDFEQLGQTAEHNALAMHATMIASWPPLLYWLPESVAAMHRVWQLRESGTPIYLTMDAGANLKLLFESQSKSTVKHHFPELNPTDIIAPFA